MKEKPLIRAVEKLGPLPAFLFANSVVTGVFSMIMCAVFGAVTAVFWTSIGSAGRSAFFYEAARVGGFMGMLLGLAILLGYAYSGDDDEPFEARARSRFVIGGLIGFIALIVIDLVTFEFLRAFFLGLDRRMGFDNDV